MVFFSSWMRRSTGWFVGDKWSTHVVLTHISAPCFRFVGALSVIMVASYSNRLKVSSTHGENKSVITNRNWWLGLKSSNESSTSKLTICRGSVGILGHSGTYGWGFPNLTAAHTIIKLKNC